MSSITHNRKKRTPDAGFTLIELVVTITVFTLLSTLALANFRATDNSLVLQNVAHQVGITIRKAQISGIATQEFNSNFSKGYGVHFQMTTPKNFWLFADWNDNKVFGCLTPCPPPPSPPPPPPVLGSNGCVTSFSECLQRYTMAKGYTIQALYGNGKSSSPGTSLSRLDVTFIRPNPDALIMGTIGSPFTGTMSQFSDAEVVLKSASGDTKTVVVWKTGQISVE